MIQKEQENLFQNKSIFSSLELTLRLSNAFFSQAYGDYAHQQYVVVHYNTFLLCGFLCSSMAKSCYVGCKTASKPFFTCCDGKLSRIIFLIKSSLKLMEPNSEKSPLSRQPKLYDLSSPKHNNCVSHSALILLPSEQTDFPSVKHTAPRRS